MLEIEIAAHVCPRRSLLARVLRFKYVEGGFVSTFVTVRNVGDEIVGCNNVRKLALVWDFRGERQVTQWIPFPQAIQPGETRVWGPRSFRIETPGNAKLGFRWAVVSAARTPNVLDVHRNPVYVHEDSERYYDPEDRQVYGAQTLVQKDGSFMDIWSASQPEVKQTLLILLAVVALAANAVLQLLRR